MQEGIVIRGLKHLEGEVKISGAKNAAVAVLPASILSRGVCKFDNIPNISDINVIYDLLIDLGAKIKLLGKSCVEIDTSCINSPHACFDMAKNIRASCYFLGALLAIFGYAKLPVPGGCNFGFRPIDQHIKGFEALGAECKITDGMIEVSCNHLVGTNIYLDVISVGATINTMIAAVKAEGVTVIENAAKEPHVVDVANFLNRIGADIMGAGTDVIKIKGVGKLHGDEYTIVPDQIEAGTYMAAAFASGGNVTIRKVIPKHLESIIAKFEEMGANVTVYDEDVNIKVYSSPKKCNIKTMPYPGFPTDMQPQVVALLSKSSGTSIINETVWGNRFRYISELFLFGANISISGSTAVIEGVSELKGAQVKATDLRAGAALIIAGLSASGVTVIKQTQYIERGYENIVEKLSALGADIRTKRNVFAKKALDIS
ncbi:MAG: UDP-N-acetylglucosamine 1-carboxyvinyltransferase [Candidatus Improbicoccus pseudotrichonymphae]|uniref:UDP-N-acetylglucosamine 1-carboxyvinyltransferase n=1 Tax=Candidatus Improbicoccus pseudotrichonymphae TaxID=3033792 RepID=A0AA48I0I8_9FIRM|nr:MAG: UDP-N-acetylglucosamine 1-carboxyvinyltransferase [Candidatus Improbicoccus pseudotrichonymphae]